MYTCLYMFTYVCVCQSICVEILLIFADIDIYPPICVTFYLPTYLSTYVLSEYIGTSYIRISSNLKSRFRNTLGTSTCSSVTTLRSLFRALLF